ncbi:MAG: helix-turn-helix transcriptional regulator [Microcoleus sp. SIO2G3]|nr:helix-turn-helix transcriptional regulator [Microcoleus sp. SIO2G3]
MISANHNIRGYTPDPTDHVVFTITPDRLRYLALTTFEEDHFDLRTEGIPFFDPFIYQIACSVRDELCADMLGGSIMIESLTTMLGIHLLRKHSSLRQQSFEQRRKLAPHKLILITDYIHNHFNQEISLTELANLADMSPFHFSRCFKDATGQSPSQYITNKRITFMQSELVNSRRSLAELSLAAGFGSQSHMSRVFKQNVGLSPGAFRKQHS